MDIVSGQILTTSVLQIHPSRLDKALEMCCWEQSPAAGGRMIQQGLFHLGFLGTQSAVVLPPATPVHPCLWPVLIAAYEPFGQGQGVLAVPSVTGADAQAEWASSVLGISPFPALAGQSQRCAGPRCPGCLPKAAWSMLWV